MWIFLFLGIFSVGSGEINGGAYCSSNETCNFPQGNCHIPENMYHGDCLCQPEYSADDCSYERYHGEEVGDLQFMCFMGIGGVGNLMIGRNGPGIAQLILCLPWLASAFAFVFWLLCTRCETYVFGKKTQMIVVCSVICVLVGWIWSMLDVFHMYNGETVDGSGYYVY